MSVTIDFETQSECDLVKHGAWRYSEDPSTAVICACWKIDDQDTERWWPKMERPDGTIRNSSHSKGMPKSLGQALHDGHEIEAHNCAFEKSVWHNVLIPQHGWWLPRNERWRDTMAVSAYYAMPMALDKLARALGFGGKHAEGGRLISKYSKLHLKTAVKEIPDEDFEKFVDYCVDDVLLECSISDYLGDLPPEELEFFLLDQAINQRGIYLDSAGIEDATAIVEARAAELKQEFRDIAGFNPTQHKQLVAWLKLHGFFFENLQKATIQDALDDDFPQGEVRRALELRLRINKASTKKLSAMARQRGSDGKARFQTRYHGASTGRNTGTGFQPLNLNRGFDSSDYPPEDLVRNISYQDARWLDLLYGDAMDAVGKASRHFIQAEPDHTIYSGDFVSVEAVLLACLAGETWKVEAFRNKVKIYELMADKIYNLPIGTVTKDTHPLERQDGKTGELAAGYQGALGAWLKFDSSGRHSDERIIEFIKMWRAEHPATTAWWPALERAAKEALEFPGSTHYVGEHIAFQMVDEWLSMILPNGKRIWYYNAELKGNCRPHWHKPHEYEDCALGECQCGYTTKIRYMAYKDGQWKWVYTYGGKFAENATQATSREILKPCVIRLEKYGYRPILTVYDEAVCQVPNGHGSKEEFIELLLVSPGSWAMGWPLSVDAWTGGVYKK